MGAELCSRAGLPEGDGNTASSGTLISELDTEHSPLIAVIDDVFAATYFPAQNPLGKVIHLYVSDQSIEIVGVVGHVNQWGLDSDPSASVRAQIYFPWLQAPDDFVAILSGTGVVVRAEADPASALASIRRMSQEMSSEQVVFGVQTMDEIIDSTLASRKFSMIILTVFAILAVLLSGIGIYGVTSYVVSQNTHEMGIRMALGAERRDVFRLILGHGFRIVVAGLCIGSAAAFGLTRLMNTMLYGVSATDPATFAGVPFLLAAVALAACYFPARRATRVDPLVALRCE